jgi:predicted adenine nucleotide alpha hydrolase (AANH) superfamily ATPase
MKPKLLFHVCCAPCSGLLSRQLRADYDVTVYFDNPNIWPEEEFKKRAQEAENFFRGEGVEFILTKWDHTDWQCLATGLELEPERGKRCKLCYHYRLKNAAEFAVQKGFEYFATSLSISPHKEQKIINNLGQALAKKYSIKYLDNDWGSNCGYQKSVAFSKEQGFYRQKYCGCEYGVKSGIL